MDEPGQLIIPHGPNEPQAGGGAPEPDRPEQPAPLPSSPTPLSEPNAGPTAQAPVPAATPSSPQFIEPVADEAGWFHQETVTATVAGEPEPLSEGLQWTASEFIAHEKSAPWYLMLVGGALVLATLVYLVTKDKISTGVVVFVAIAFGVFAGRKPRTQQYSLSGHGLQIGQKFYGMQDFKTFSVSIDGAIASVVLNPLKRFMPPLTIYVAPDLEEKVVDFLSAYLPFEQHKADPIDSLLKRVRF